MKHARDEDDETRRRRYEAIEARARAHWTPEVTRGLLGDKHLLLPPRDAAPLLRAMGLIDRHTVMSPESVRKYMQISHMATLLEPTLLDLVPADQELRLIDAACGASYLTAVLAWLSRHRWRRPLRVLGVDRNHDLIDRSRQMARDILLEDILRFIPGSLDELDPARTWERAFGDIPEAPAIHVLVALHACDVATDQAIAVGLRAQALLIAVAPCCHAQLSRDLGSLSPDVALGSLAPLMTMPHLRREAAATLTDTMRTLLMRACGYEVTPMEFVPSTHTPKNTLLRAKQRSDPRLDADALRQYLALKRDLGGVGVALEGWLPSHVAAALDSLGA